MTESMHIFCDFDGTITLEDTTDYILNRLALPEWEDVEAEWEQGLIGSAECMQRQIALIHATKDVLDEALDQVVIDPGFIDLVDFCRIKNIKLTIISDGVDYFIHRVLTRIGMGYLPVIANRLVFLDDGGYQLQSPYAQPSCKSAAGVCKCAAVVSTHSLIYIGDGRSDFCVSHQSPLVFAKNKLAVYCQENAIAFTAYQTLHDVKNELAQLAVTVPSTNTVFA